MFHEKSCHLQNVSLKGFDYTEHVSLKSCLKIKLIKLLHLNFIKIQGVLHSYHIKQPWQTWCLRVIHPIICKKTRKQKQLAAAVGGTAHALAVKVLQVPGHVSPTS